MPRETLDNPAASGDFHEPKAPSLAEREIAERDAAQRECSRLREEVRRAEEDRQAAAENGRGWQERHDALLSQFSDAVADARSQRVRAQTLRSNLDECRAGLSAAEARVAALEEQSANKTEMIEARDRLLDRLEDERDEARENRAALQARVDQVNHLLRLSDGTPEHEAVALASIRALLLSPPAAATPAPAPDTIYPEPQDLTPFADALLASPDAPTTPEFDSAEEPSTPALQTAEQGTPTGKTVVPSDLEPVITGALVDAGFLPQPSPPSASPDRCAACGCPPHAPEVCKEWFGSGCERRVQCGCKGFASPDRKELKP